MKKLSTAISELVESNEFLQLGLQHKLLNLSQTARFLQNQVEARSKREVEISALTMALSRQQKEMNELSLKARTFPKIANMTIHSNLLVCVFSVTAEIRKSINKLYNKVHKDSGYITITEGITDVSIITEEKYSDYLDEYFVNSPNYRYENVSSLAVKFGPTFFETVGVFHSLVQQLYFQNVNILEMASAGTEFILYLEEKDVRIAFDTVYRKMHLASHDQQ